MSVMPIERTWNHMWLKEECVIGDDIGSFVWCTVGAQ